MASFTNNSGGPRIINTTDGPRTIQAGETADFDVSENEAAAISRLGFLDAPSDEPRQPQQHDMAASTIQTDVEIRDGQDVTISDEDRAFGETFIGRNLNDISDEEVAALTPGQRAAVLAAERDREQPRKTLLSRLGASA